MSQGMRRATAELVGTAFLVAAVVGSGIAAQQLSPHDVGLQLLENSLATGAVLVALILALQPVSASFNPVVTLVEALLGRLDLRAAVPLVVAQLVGGATGTVVANLMFGRRAVSLSVHHRASTPHLLAEVVATLGLVVVFGTVRSPRIETVAFAVGGYITGAYWFTSSTSFANPAVAVARMLSDTFAGIAPASVPGFVLAQLLGGMLGAALVAFLHPDPAAAGSEQAHRRRRGDRPSEACSCSRTERAFDPGPPPASVRGRKSSSDLR